MPTFTAQAQTPGGNQDGGIAAALVVGTTLVQGGTDGSLLYDNNGLLGEIASSGFVSSFSAGATGLTPSSPTGGDVVLAGTLAIANGGTNGTATPTNGGVSYGTGTAYAFTLAGSSGQILRSNGAAAPTWVDLSTLGVSAISFGTTGLTPNSATAGAVTVAGTLAVANGGTGITSFGTGVATALGQNVNGTAGGLVLGTDASLTTPTINTAASVGGTWTAAATWTLPAFTLGGTVTGTGQTITGATIVAPNVTVTANTVPANGMYLPGTNKIGFATNTTAAGVIDASQNLTIGATTQVGLGQTATGTAVIQTLSAAPTSRLNFSNVAFSDSTAGAFFLLGHSRGAAIGTNTIIQNNDQAGSIIFTGANGTGFSTAAQITVNIDGTPGALDDMPGRLALATSPDGSATTVAHLQISSAGLITLPTLATDATHTTRTVCQDTTSTALYYGSGAAGICLGTSSVRFKDLKGPVKAGLKDVLGWQTVAYRYNQASGMPSDRDLLGFTAEQVYTVTPEIVGKGLDGQINTIDMMGMIPILANAIKEQQAQIESLKEKTR